MLIASLSRMITILRMDRNQNSKENWLIGYSIRILGHLVKELGIMSTKKQLYIRLDICFISLLPLPFFFFMVRPAPGPIHLFYHSDSGTKVGIFYLGKTYPVICLCFNLLFYIQEWEGELKLSRVNFYYNRKMHIFLPQLTMPFLPRLSELFSHSKQDFRRIKQSSLTNVANSDHGDKPCSGERIKVFLGEA